MGVTSHIVSSTYIYPFFLHHTVCNVAKAGLAAPHWNDPPSPALPTWLPHLALLKHNGFSLSIDFVFCVLSLDINLISMWFSVILSSCWLCLPSLACSEFTTGFFCLRLRSSSSGDFIYGVPDSLNIGLISAMRTKFYTYFPSESSCITIDIIDSKSWTTEGKNPGDTEAYWRVSIPHQEPRTRCPPCQLPVWQLLAFLPAWRPLQRPFLRWRSASVSHTQAWVWRTDLVHPHPRLYKQLLLSAWLPKSHSIPGLFLFNLSSTLF